jgi:hypothetical protein
MAEGHETGTQLRPPPMQSRSSMPYELRRLAPGSFDVVLDGVVVASLVRSGPHQDATWSAELLLDLDQKDRPPPFRRLEHQFATFEEARNWLGNPEIASEP